MANVRAVPRGGATTAFQRSVTEIADSVARQRKLFLETARALGCDENEAAFDEKLKTVVGPQGKMEEGKPTSEKG